MEDKKKPNMPIPAAPGLCEECIEKKHEIFDDEEVATCYCSHNQTGGLFQIDRCMWRLSTPISEEEFRRLSQAQRSGIKAGKQRHQKEIKIKNPKCPKWN
jgi:hypothetical protein